MDEPREPGSAPPPLPATEDRGLPHAVRFDGILEGPLGDAGEVRRTVAALNELEIGHADLDVDGGRFSLLMDDRVVDGRRFGVARREDFVRALQAVVSSAARPESVESTLRCVAVYEAEAVETLFGVVSGEVRVVSRARSLCGEDQRVADPSTSVELPRYSKIQALILGLTLFALAGVLSWKYGYVDRLLSAEAEGLKADTGAFGETLSLEVKASWGNYEVVIRRGAAYPKTPEEAEALEKAAQTTGDRAAIRAVADGGEIYVRLQNEDGKVVHRERVELSKLLSEEDGEVEVELEGSMAAREVVLALDEGSDP